MASTPHCQTPTTRCQYGWLHHNTQHKVVGHKHLRCVLDVGVVLVDMATNTTTGGMGGHWVVLLTRGCLKCMDTTQGVVGFVCGVGEQAHGACVLCGWCVCCVAQVCFVVCVVWPSTHTATHQHHQQPRVLHFVWCVLKANEWQQCNTSSGPLVCCVVVWHHQHHCACCCCWWWMV